MNGSKVLRILLAGLLIINIFAMAGCKEELPEYGNIVQAIATYRTNYYEYCKKPDDSRIVVTQETAARPDGTTCRSCFVRSSDDKYISVILEYEKNNTTMVDEYYYLSDKAFYIDNSYLDASNSPVVTQYYVWNGKLYVIDDESSSLKEADESVASGFYTSFDKLIESYGQQSR